MPRPLKPSRQLRQRFDLYLDEAEIDQIRANAEAARLPMSIFVRRVALRLHIEVPPPAANVELWRELAPLASNLNQIALACNSGLLPAGVLPVVIELTEQVRLLRLDLLGVAQPTSSRRRVRKESR